MGFETGVSPNSAVTFNGGNTYVSNFGERDFINPRDYRTVLDADDTNGLEAAGNAAIAKNLPLIIAEKLAISSTITWGSPTGGPTYLNVYAFGEFAYIKWNGGSNTTIFQTWNLNKSNWEGLWILFSGAQTNVTIFNDDVGTSTTSNNTIRNCIVSISTGQTGIVCWNVGQTAATGQDISGWKWDRCVVTGVDAATSGSGNFGWALGGWNSCNHTWDSCGCTGMQAAITSLAVSGGVQNALANGWTIIRPSFHGNYEDLDIAFDNSGGGHFNGTVKIVGGKMENQVHRCLHVNTNGTTSTQPINVSFDGTDFYNCTTDDGYLWELNAAGNLSVANSTIGGVGAALGNIAKFSCATTSTGTAKFSNCQFDVSSSPWWTTGTGTWNISTENCTKVRNGVNTGAFSNVSAGGTFLGVAPPLIQTGSGLYYQPTLTLTTSVTLGNGILRVQPVVIPIVCTIEQLFAEFTVAGDAASLFATAIYADNGKGSPGALIATGPTISTGSGNAGNVATGGTPGVYAGAISGGNVTLQPGLYWIGGVVQGVTVTQPTIRTALWSTQSIGTSALPVANQQTTLFDVSGVTGALPNPFTGGTPAGSSNPPRVGFQVV